ncbi:hypothetical protein ABZT08_18865 [Streptomyces sp. NPDC005526]|uniref:hypothetical protein n=1 Tax=Streptomyces sp. NPDC005526 TaxID=3156885 RepID=UPI00339FE1EF
MGERDHGGHVPPDDLAALALDERRDRPGRGAERDTALAHVAECRLCGEALDELRRVVAAGRTVSPADEVARPPARVWHAIAAEVHHRPGVSPPRPACEPPVPAGETSVPSRSRDAPPFADPPSSATFPGSATSPSSSGTPDSPGTPSSRDHGALRLRLTPALRRAVRLLALLAAPVTAVLFVRRRLRARGRGARSRIRTGARAGRGRYGAG